MFHTICQIIPILFLFYLPSSLKDNKSVDTHNLVLAADTACVFDIYNGSRLRLFVYLDSTACHKCFLQNKYRWMEYEKLEDFSGGKISFNIIISPKAAENKVLLDYIDCIGYCDKIFLDRGQTLLLRLKRRTVFEPGKPVVLLLDNNGRILFIGNPDKNDSIRKRMNKAIKSHLSILC